MTRSEINEYNQGYRHASNWLARQRSHEQIEQAANALADHNMDLWQRGFCNSLRDWVSTYSRPTLELV